MTTLAPRPVRSQPRHPRLVTVVAIALLIAGLTIGLLLAFSSGTAGPSSEPAPPGGVSSVTGPPADEPCRSMPARPC